MLRKVIRLAFISASVACLLNISSFAQSLIGTDLTHALQHGGYVVVMRHASSPHTPPSQNEKALGNDNGERQLDQQGIENATRFGETLRKLHIPIGDVYSSPAFRAQETTKYAGLVPFATSSQIGDNGNSMSSVRPEQTVWLQTKVRQARPGKNVFIVTHMPNIAAAFPDEASHLKDGEALIFAHTKDGEAKLVARVPIEDWPKLSAESVTTDR